MLHRTARRLSGPSDTAAAVLAAPTVLTAEAVLCLSSCGLPRVPSCQKVSWLASCHGSQRTACGIAQHHAAACGSPSCVCVVYHARLTEFELTLASADPEVDWQAYMEQTATFLQVFGLPYDTTCFRALLCCFDSANH